VQLRWHYGAQLFKCHFVTCPFAFEKKSLRDMHIKDHDRSWKCEISSCEFAAIGFVTLSDYQDHVRKCHNEAKPSRSDPVGPLDTDEIQSLLLDLIKEDKVEEMRSVLPQARKLCYGVVDMLLRTAGTIGSLAMANVLCTHLFKPDDGAHYDINMITLAIASIKGGNMELIEWTMSEYGEQSRGIWDIPPINDLTISVLQSESPEIFDMWDKRLVARKADTALWWIRRTGISQRQIGQTLEARLLGVWRREARCGRFKERSLGKALSEIAQRSCSTTQAKVLLECGAFVDYRKSSSYLTPLHHAARKNTLEAAELMKLLLLWGANPRPMSKRSTYGKKRISAEVGPCNISKWLGMTWDELVQWAEEERSLRNSGEKSKEE
jgi:hypothetical protein